MTPYAYAFHTERRDGEVFFVFPKFPEIVSAIPREYFASWDAHQAQSHAEDAVITALQGYVSALESIPDVDDPRLLAADGFVSLNPQQAMKLELARVVAANCNSVAEFARRIEKHDTAARRLLNLRHRSTPDEVTEAMAKFGKRLVHQWGVEPIPKSAAVSTVTSVG